MEETSIPQEDPKPEIGMTSEAPPPVEPLSVTDKFIGILTEPAVTFENVRAAGQRTSDWIVPVIVVSLILGVGMFIRFSNPDMAAEMMQKQSEAVQAQVDSGDMTQEQADAASTQLESMKGVIGIISAASAAIGYFFVFFFIALLYWLVVRFAMQGDASYGMILSVLGLSAWINAIDQLVSLLLTFITGSMFANLSPALFTDGDITAITPKLLMLLNPIAIWAVYVAGIGFEKTANISRTKAMIAAFGIWILFSGLSMVMGWGGMG
ncbi:MAG: hypothetical protein C0600_07200 [Ignavibacteria bacterium]|nr:MAG: hypothetical protein C0600_07200 [Ignavibacteria bacterium]